MHIFFIVIKAVLNFLKIPLFIVLGFIALFLFMCTLYYLYYRIFKHMKLSRMNLRLKRKKKRSFFRRLLIDAPRRVVLDAFERKFYFFNPQGLVIFTGIQGSGKTSAMSRYILDLQEAYPFSWTITNFGLLTQDDELVHYLQLVDYKNGKKGVIVGIDELQNWFSSRASRDFPPEMLSVVTQNRKNRRVILGTAQSFYMIAKDIRSQCTEVRQCVTLLRCITIVLRRRPVCNEAGDVKQMKFLGMYWFVHDDKLRNSYDTYKVIDNLKKSGFANPKIKIT